MHIITLRHCWHIFSNNICINRGFQCNVGVSFSTSFVSPSIVSMARSTHFCVTHHFMGMLVLCASTSWPMFHRRCQYPSVACASFTFMPHYVRLNRACCTCLRSGCGTFMVILALYSFKQSLLHLFQPLIFLQSLCCG